LIEQSGQFAYLYDGKKINLYRINPTTGALTKLSSPLTTAASVQIDATKNFLYLLLNGTMSIGGASLTPTVIAAYKINHTTGTLTIRISFVPDAQQYWLQSGDHEHSKVRNVFMNARSSVL